MKVWLLGEKDGGKGELETFLNHPVPFTSVLIYQEFFFLDNNMHELAHTHVCVDIHTHTHTRKTLKRLDNAIPSKEQNLNLVKELLLST